MSFPNQLANYIANDIQSREDEKDIEAKREWRKHELDVNNALASLEQFWTLVMKAQPYLAESAMRSYLEDLKFLYRNVRLFPLAIPGRCDALADSVLTSVRDYTNARRKQEALKKKRQEEKRNRDLNAYLLILWFQKRIRL